MAQNKWTIVSTTGTGGGGIQGCKIVQDPSGYSFTQPKGLELASLPLSAPSLTFDFTNYKDLDWSVSITNLVIGGTSTGSWKAYGDESTDPEEGDWTAQAGAGGHPDPDEDAGTNAASASV